MGLYRQNVVPRLLALAMRHRRLEPYRVRVAGAAEGRVLEIGAGAGANLAYYPARVNDILALEPEPYLLDRAVAAAHELDRSLTALRASAETIPVDTASVDTVMLTWTACSIPYASAALAEMRRVLRPAGRLLFVEHGRAPEARVRAWQHRLTPIWRRIAGGCHLNRPMDRLIAEAGFRSDHLHTGYLGRPKTLTYMYDGSARVV